MDTTPSAAELSKALQLVQKFVECCEPDCYTGDDAAKMVKLFSRLKRSATAGELLFARRVEKTGLHQREGHKQAGSWLANVTGEPVGKSASELETARSMEAHPEISEAFKAGNLSEAQAREIASAADRCPEQARDLVEEASSLTLVQLKKRCFDVRAGASSADEEIARHERIRKNRSCRTWVDSEGAGHLEARMTADALGVIKANLGRFEKEIFEDARKDGRRETHQAYMADALVAMALASVASGESGGSDGGLVDGEVDGSDVGSPERSTRRRRAVDPKALMRLRIDADAFLRGYAEPGETCSIPGVGPVPVAAARALLGEAILELVITKGVDVTTVVSDSRYVRKALQIALEERDPVCVIPGCDKSDPLERDHWRVDFIDKGPTSIDNLARLCPFHHDQKTHRGWVLDGGPGQWRFFKPDRTPAADGTPGAEPESESDVADTAGERQARRRTTPANDPPEQQPLL